MLSAFVFLDPETGPQWLRTLFLLSLCFTADVFLLFILPRNLQAPSADRHETLPHDRNLGEFYNASPKIRAHSPRAVAASGISTT